MSNANSATDAQLKSIEEQTGKSLTDLIALLAATKLVHQSELTDYAQSRLALSAIDAEFLVALYVKSIARSTAEEKAAGDPVADA